MGLTTPAALPNQSWANTTALSSTTTKAIVMDPKNITAYSNRGQIYKITGKYDRAIADYTTAISLGLKVALVYHNRGLAYRAKGDTARSNTDLD